MISQIHQVFSHPRQPQKHQRLEGQKKHKADRQEKRARTHGNSVKDDIELENIFTQFGLTLLNPKVPRDAVFSQVPVIMQGRKPELISSKALDFLVQEFDVEVITDTNGRTILNFPQKPKGDEMNLFAEVAEKSGQKRSVVKAVYEALLSRIRVNLKNERRVRLPDFAVVKVQFRKAKEKRRGRNPFNGKKMWFKARPASNKLRITPLKRMKDWCAEKLEVIEPKKKSKKSKKSK